MIMSGTLSIEKANKRTNGSCKTAEDILKTVKEWHPILQLELTEKE